MREFAIYFQEACAALLNLIVLSAVIYWNCSQECNSAEVRFSPSKVCFWNSTCLHHQCWLISKPTRNYIIVGLYYNYNRNAEFDTPFLFFYYAFCPRRKPTSLVHIIFLNDAPQLIISWLFCHLCNSIKHTKILLLWNWGILWTWLLYASRRWRDVWLDIQEYCVI